MGKIYKAQSKLRITLDTNATLTGCTAKIKYRKPSGTTGEVNALISDDSVYYDLTATTFLNESGLWQFWAHITYADALVAEGEPVGVMIYESGT